jgi:hypothetical protein
MGADEMPATKDGLCPLERTFRQGLDDDLAVEFAFFSNVAATCSRSPGFRTKRTPRLAVPMPVLTTAGKIVVRRNSAADAVISVCGCGSRSSVSSRENPALPWAVT